MTQEGFDDALHLLFQTKNWFIRYFFEKKPIFILRGPHYRYRRALERNVGVVLKFIVLIGGATDLSVF